MYGNSSKQGGGGRVGGARVGGVGSGPHSKRSSFPPPPRPNRPGFRPSLGGGVPSNNSRSNNIHSGSTAANGAGPSTGVEETFSLVSGRNSNSFAIIVKMAPGMVEELKKVEALGEVPRIKFDALEISSVGNVIEVGGKEFKFTWSTESPDLCDIFEEQQSGEDGSGLLLQSGSCLRKANVQRTLDESMTNHVKMRSEEAERKLKSRKSIVLDHGNPSMKNQLKQMAAVETSPWKNFKQKKELPVKKQKTEGTPATTKSTFTSAASIAPKSRRSSSPLRCSPDQIHVPMPAHSFKDQSGSDMTSQMKKENLLNPGKEDLHKTASIPRSPPCLKKESPATHKGIASQAEFQKSLITLLKENPKGISYKALEKSLGNDFPSFIPKMETILNKIATSQGSGRYILKPGLDTETFSRSISKTGSSPEVKETHGHDIVNAKLDEDVVRISDEHPQTHLNVTEGVESAHRSSELEADKKISENNGLGVSSNDSGSDSDSESSDSDSESGSHSRSRSAVGSGSASSGESDTDASCNSKEGSDMDVDIMKSDDENDYLPNNLASELEAKSPLIKVGNVDVKDRISSDYDAFEATEQVLDGEKELGIIQSSGQIHNGDDDDRDAIFGKLFGGSETLPSEIPEMNSKIKSKRDFEGYPGEKNEIVKRVRRTLDSDHERSTCESPQADDARLFSHKAYHDLHLQTVEKSGKGKLNDDGLKSLRESTHEAITKSKERKIPKNKKETPPSDSNFGKQGEIVGNPRGIVRSSPGEEFVSEKTSGRTLQRELSDLELGELREPFDENPVNTELENKASTSDNFGVHRRNFASVERKNSGEIYDSNVPMSRQKVGQQSRKGDDTEMGSQTHKRAESNGKVRKNESRSKQERVMDAHDNGSKRASSNLQEPSNSRHDHFSRSSSRNKRNRSGGFKDGFNDSSAKSKKKNRSSSEEDSSSYSKYDKEKPELKGPIYEASIYKEYIQEYREKFDCYCSLNKILQNYKVEFSKFGKDMELAAGKDTERYNKIRFQVTETYRRYKSRHKRVKKVFVVLHEELKSLKQRIKDYAARQ